MATQALGRGLRTGLSALPIASTENVAKAEEMYAPSRARATEAIAEQALLGEGVSFAKGEEARAKESLAQKVREAGAESLRLAAEEEKGLVDVAKQEKEKNPFPTFSPTQEDAMSYGQLGSMIATLGVMLGASGKASAKAAIGSMTGMMNGWKQGRKDLWEKEAKTFEKEVNRIKMVRDSITKDLETGLKLASTNRAESRARLEAAAHQLGSGSVLASMIATGRAVDALELAKKSANLAKETDNKILDMATRQTQHEAQLAAAERQRQATLEAARIRAEAITDKGKEVKPLKESQLKPIQAFESIANSLEELKKDFKNEYASLGVLGFGADFSFEAKRRLGTDEGAKAVSWWSRYNRLQAPNRHALFGATLTGNEIKNYQSFTTKPSDDAGIVKQLLQDQINYSKSEANSKKQFYENAGYKVPEYKSINFDSTFSESPPPISLLKPGIETKFAGKGTWTLIDGKPSKIKD